MRIDKETVIKGVVAGVVALVAIWALGAILSPQTTTRINTTRANQNTMRNAFISACEGGTSDVIDTLGVTPTQVSAYCSCAERQLIGLHPDLYTNKSVMNRVVRDGYNKTETDAIITCIGRLGL